MLNHLATTLIGRETVEPFLLAIEDADSCGAVHLMTGESEEVAIEVLDIDGEVGNALGTVDHHRNPMLMGDADDVLNGIDGSENIAHMGAADNFRLVGEELLVFVETELSVVGHRYDFQYDAFLPCLQLPWNNIGVVLHRRYNHFVAGLHELVAES